MNSVDVEIAEGEEPAKNGSHKNPVTKEALEKEVSDEYESTGEQQRITQH